jgi:hypothetical protein
MIGPRTVNIASNVEPFATEDTTGAETVRNVAFVVLFGKTSINGMAVNARSAVQFVTKGTTGFQTPRNVCGAPLSAILAPAECAKGPAKSRVSYFVGLGRKSA